MSDCFINPSASNNNQIIKAFLDAFGENFAPNFSPILPPPSASAVSQEPTTQFQGPANIKFSPIPSYNYNGNMLDGIAPYLNAIAGVLNLFGPLFLVVDVINGIIDIICALGNIPALIKAVTKFFSETIPALLTLFPVYALAPLLISVAKGIIAFTGGALVTILPIIDQIVLAAQQLSQATADGDINVMDALGEKICDLSKQLQSSSEIFKVLGFIFELISIFETLSKGFPCQTDCCDEDNCPAILNDPAIGKCSIIENTNSIVIPVIDFEIVKPRIKIRINNANGKRTDTAYSNADIAKYKNYLTINPELDPTVQVFINNKQVTVLEISNNEFLLDSSADELGVNLGDIVDYEVIVQKQTMLRNNLVSVGCMDTVAAAKLAALNNNANIAKSILDITGTKFPVINLAALQIIVNDQIANPETNQGENVGALFNSYIGDLTDYVDSLICSSFDPLKSEFTIDRTFVATKTEFATLSFIPRDATGNPLLKSSLPSSKIKFEFSATHGLIFDETLDRTTGVITAKISSEVALVSEIVASLKLNNKTCGRPSILDANGEVTEKILTATFILAGGLYPRVRTGIKNNDISRRRRAR